jgi:hypothetical protein
MVIAIDLNGNWKIKVYVIGDDRESEITFNNESQTWYKGFRVIVFNVTFNNISVISWWSVWLVEITTDLPQVTGKLCLIILYQVHLVNEQDSKHDIKCTHKPHQRTEFIHTFCGVCGAQLLVFCVQFCRPLFVFFFWSLYFQFFYDLRRLIIHLASWNISCGYVIQDPRCIRYIFVFGEKSLKIRKW